MISLNLKHKLLSLPLLFIIITIMSVLIGCGRSDSSETDISEAETMGAVESQIDGMISDYSPDATGISFTIEDWANSFAKINWDLNPDQSMNFNMRMADNDEEYTFTGSWRLEGNSVIITFVAETLYLEALFDWNEKGENNIQIENDREVSFNQYIEETNVYGVLCTVTRTFNTGQQP